MRWFWQQSDSGTQAAKQAEELKPASASTATSTTSLILHKLLNPTTLVSTAILTTGILLSARLYTTYLTRISNAAHLPASHFRNSRRTLFGRVTSVGDADNFRLYHTPGGRLVLWGTALRRIPSERKALQNQTVHVRIAGVDAPELAHFGKPAQPRAAEALAWLDGTLSGKLVRVLLHRRDQYERVVGTVWLRRGWLGVFGKRDVGLEMLKAGWATVYEARFGAEFGGEANEKLYRQAEATAKRERRGIWADHTASTAEKITMAQRAWRWLGYGARTDAAADFESPRQYKTRMAKLDQQEAAVPVRGTVKSKK